MVGSTRLRGTPVVVIVIGIEQLVAGQTGGRATARPVRSAASTVVLRVGLGGVADQQPGGRQQPVALRRVEQAGEARLVDSVTDLPSSSDSLTAWYSQVSRRPSMRCRRSSVASDAATDAIFGASGSGVFLVAIESSSSSAARSRRASSSDASMPTAKRGAETVLWVSTRSSSTCTMRRNDSMIDDADHRGQHRGRDRGHLRGEPVAVEQRRRRRRRGTSRRRGRRPARRRPTRISVGPRTVTTTSSVMPAASAAVA